MNLSDSRIIELPKIADNRGNLSFLENMRQIPFDIKRVYWIYDVPGGEYRWGHAYRHSQEMIIALSGSFDVVVDDGRSRRKFCLNRSYYGLYVPHGLWREFENFSTNSFSLVVSSTSYDEADYIRDYARFLKLKIDGEI